MALGGAIVAVGLVAWACSGTGGDDEGTQAQNAAGLATATPSDAPQRPVPTVTVTEKVTAEPDAPRRSGDACDPDDVVVTLQADKKSYPGKERPRFRLIAVNTGKRACTFDVGPKELKLRITSGSDRVWSSADCARGSGSSPQMLKRGEPYIGSIEWDRKRSTKNCEGARTTSGAGTYVARIKGHKGKVDKQVFRLG